MIDKKKRKRISECLKWFFLSPYFGIFCVVFGCITTVSGIEVVSIVVLAGVTALSLLFCDTLVPSLMPFMTLCTVAIKCFNSFNTFIRILWLGAFGVAAIIYFFIKNRRKIKAGPFLPPLILISVAVICGGVGIISREEYFALTSLYYMLGLGLAMILVYIIFCTYYSSEEKVDVGNYVAHYMYLINLLCILMILLHYIINIKTVIETGSVLKPQWRNNITTFMMLTMPLTFYLSRFRPFRLFVALLNFPCMLLTSSRSALLFGTVEFLICCVYYIIIDKPHRRRNGIVFGALAAAALVSIPFVGGFILDTLKRFSTTFIENEPRFGLWKRAFVDFRANPIFGRGIGYMGNRDVHPSVKFAACWYHCSVLQVIGSFGIVGIIAYGWQFIRRIRIFRGRMNSFTAALLICYVGIFMISLVNPGEFSPIPYEMITILYFVLIQQTNPVPKTER